jgi:SpoVK/Ycf46/Vps4 family AAA+-type ATPase
VLLEDMPGTGKTTLANAPAEARPGARLIQGQEFVPPERVREIVVPALAHR